MRRKNFFLQYNAPVTLTFTVLAFAALMIGQATKSASTMKYFCVYRSSLADFWTYPRFLTHVLGHSSFSHFSGNIMLMLVLGPTLEERYGSKNILSAILVTAFISGLIQWLLFPNTALLGASGIVFMMIIMASLGGMRGGGLPLTMVLVFIIYIGGEVVSGVTAADNISHVTHIVGGICGAVMGIGTRRGK